MTQEGLAGLSGREQVDPSTSLKALVTPLQELGVAPEGPEAAASARGPAKGSVARPSTGTVDRPAQPGGRVVGAKRPYHVGVAFGVAASLYAGSLAVVTRLQIDHDQTLIADRQPVRDAIDLLHRHHDAMDGNLSVAANAYDDAAESYDQLVLELANVHQDVATLAKRVHIIRRLAVVDGRVWPASPESIRPPAPSLLPPGSRLERTTSPPRRQ